MHWREIAILTVAHFTPPSYHTGVKQQQSKFQASKRNIETTFHEKYSMTTSIDVILNIYFLHTMKCTTTSIDVILHTLIVL